MSRCRDCGRTGIDEGMTMCDSCLRRFGTWVQELEDQGIDTTNPDDPRNPMAPPR